MPVFRPPTQPDALVGGGEASHPLWRFYGAYETGVTVWKDPNNVYHSTAYPYQGGAEYRTFNDGNVTTTVDDPLVSLASAKAVYLGGSEYVITDAVRTELIAAGFGDFVSYDSYLKINNINSYFSTVDKPSLNVNNLDVRILAESAVDNWLPLFLSNHIVSKGVSVSWVVSIHPDAVARTALYPELPVIGLGPGAKEPLGFKANRPHWFRSTVKFKTATDTREFIYWRSPDNIDWYPMGTSTIEPTSQTLTDTGQDLMVPGSGAALSWLSKIYYMELLDDIDGVPVAIADFRNLAPGTTSFTDPLGNIWNRTGTDVEVVGV